VISIYIAFERTFQKYIPYIQVRNQGVLRPS